MYAGCQDNGSLRYWGNAAWFQAPQGDGGGIAVDPGNPRQLMRQYTDTVLSRSTDGGMNVHSWHGFGFPPDSNSTEKRGRAFTDP